jgi:glycosyltransferase involved in cell wall biosynthesis
MAGNTSEIDRTSFGEAVRRDSNPPEPVSARLSLLGPVYPYRGGIAHHTSQLASTLQNAGHQVQVLSFSRQYPKWLFPGETDRDPSLHPQKVGAQFILDPLYPWTWNSTARRIAAFKPDAAIIPWWTTFYGPAYWSVAKLLKRKGVDVLFLIHNVLPHESRPLDRWVVRKVLEQGDYFLVQSPGEQSRLLDLLPGARVAMCAHPIYDFFSPGLAPKDQAKEELGIPPQNPVVLCFGFVRPYKGLSQAIAAIGSLQAQGIPAHLLVAGEFWEDKKKYEAQIERLGIAGHVTMIDRYIPDEEIPRYFSAADVFVAPYLQGSQSGATRIALSFGIPVVATESIADEMLASNPLALIVAPGDREALTDGIVQALGKGGAPPVTGEEAAKTWSQMASTIESLLRYENTR